MTISTQTNKVNHLGTGTQTVFPYRFLVLDETHMEVYINDVEITTGWTIDGIGDPNGGDVTFETAPIAGTTVTLLRWVPMTQEIDYLSFEPFPADVHESGFDKQTQLIQQLQEQLSRSINLPTSDDGTTSVLFPAYDPGKLIGWCELTKSICNFDVPTCPDPYYDPYRQMCGSINSSGAVIKQMGDIGFTVNVLGIGNHQIVFDTPITETYVVVVSIVKNTTINGWGATVFVTEETTNGFTIAAQDDETGATTTRDWSFHLVWEVPE